MDLMADGFVIKKFQETNQNEWFVWFVCLKFEKKENKTERDSCLNIKEKDFEIFEHKNS